MPELEGFEEMKKALSPSAALLNELAEFAIHMERLNGFVPADQSIGMEELNQEAHTYAKRSVWTGPITDTHSLAGVTLFTAGDFTRSYASLLVANQIPVFGYLAMARSALEASVIAEWLNDPRVDPLERIRRGLAEKLYSAHEMWRFPETRADAVRQIVEIKQVATNYGWTVSGNRQPAAIGDKGRPSIPDSFSRLIVGDVEKMIGKALWSYLSGVGHSTWWALRQSIVEPPGFSKSPLGATPAGFGTQSHQVHQQTICLVRAPRAATSARLRLMGWRDDEWTLLEKRVMEMERAILRTIAANQGQKEAS